MGVKLVLDECEAVLEAIEADLTGNSALRDRAVEKVFAAQGYRWLKERESAMGNLGQPFVDSEFEEFVLSAGLKTRFQQLRTAIQDLKHLDLDKLVRQAKEYLPENCAVDSYIVPLIKPLKNSFVYPIDDKIVVFLYLDSQYNRGKTENTIIHELHHVGLGFVYQENSPVLRSASKPTVREMIKWTQALGEGYAMLAASGGADRHPSCHDLELKKNWDKRMEFFEADFLRVNQFFADLLNHQYDEEEAMKRGLEMMGTQGPWYTVGWQVAVTIERVYGRQCLVECIANPTLLFATFNRAAEIYNRDNRVSLPTWSQELITAV